jgi:hypothetical protein
MAGLLPSDFRFDGGWEADKRVAMGTGGYSGQRKRFGADENDTYAQ